MTSCILTTPRKKKKIHWLGYRRRVYSEMKTEGYSIHPKYISLSCFTDEPLFSKWRILNYKYRRRGSLPSDFIHFFSLLHSSFSFFVFFSLSQTFFSSSKYQRRKRNAIRKGGRGFNYNTYRQILTASSSIGEKTHPFFVFDKKKTPLKGYRRSFFASGKKRQKQ